MEAPFVVVEDSEQAKALVDTGYFKSVPDDAQPTPKAPENRPVTTYDSKTKAELLAIAKEQGIKVTGKESKAQLLKLVLAPQMDKITGPDVDIFTDGLETPPEKEK
ncbi:MAG: hypothetical protein NC311_10565 [Muribaculaceae bacterium]|nr:hypothetical protein [Muribaculaceae bacterium]